MPKNPEVLAALSTLTKALESEPMPADVAMARLLEMCTRIESKLDQLLARPVAPVVTIAPVVEPAPVTTPTAAPAAASTPAAAPAEPKRGRKAKAEEKPAAPAPAPEAPPACTVCGTTLTPENSSKRHSDGALVHVGCPKAEPAPGDVEVLNVRQLKAAPATPAPEAPKAEPKPAEPPPAPAPAAEASGLPSFEVLRQAALAHIQRHGKPSLLAALSTYGAQKISDLQDSDKVAALEKLNGPACVEGAPLA